MMGYGKLANTPMVRACLEVANKYGVREVSLAAVHRDEKSRTLKVTYETGVNLATSEEQTAEMEAMAKFAWDQAVQAERLEIANAKIEDLDGRGPAARLTVRFGEAGIRRVVARFVRSTGKS